MDPLSVLTIPHILQGAAKAVSFAWSQYSLVEEHKDRCKLLIERCQDVIVEVAKLLNQDEETLQEAMRTNIIVLESSCTKIKDTIAHLASKGFIWRVLHQSEVVMALKAADDAVIDAYSRFNMNSLLGIHQLQTRITAAATRDQTYLVSRLQTLERNDEEILGVLQTTGLRVEELFVAFMKFTQNPRPERASLPAEAFIRKAANTLKRLSNASDVAIPRWSLTSLDVEFDRTNKASCIGRGRFGSIYRGQWDGLLVAVKEMHVAEAQALDETQLNIIRHEIEIWSSLTHPHVLPFYGACLEAAQPFMVSRLCSKGNALQYLRQHPDADRISLMLGIALGMTYLHRKGIIHADIKALNILIGDDGKSLIADFGLSKIQDQITSTLSGRASNQQAVDGTLRWLAPERLDGRLGKPCDVYSFGITAWELFAEAIPFAGVPDRAVLFVVVDQKKRPERPSTMTNDSVWTLVQHCWEDAPPRRPTFDNIRITLQTLDSSDARRVNGKNGSSYQSASATMDASRNESLPSNVPTSLVNVRTDEHLLEQSALPEKGPPSNLSTEFTSVALGQHTPARPATPVLQTSSTNGAQLSVQDTDLQQERHQMSLQKALPELKPLARLRKPSPQPALSKMETTLSPQGRPTIKKPLGIGSESSRTLNPPRDEPSFSRLVDTTKVSEIDDELQSSKLTTSSMESVNPQPQKAAVSMPRETAREEPSAIKCVLVGDRVVEKTQLLIRYATDVYPGEYAPPVLDTCSVTLMRDEQPYVLALFDISGLEDYHRLRTLSYPQTDVFLLGFNVTSPDSFQNVEDQWLPEVSHHCPGVPFLIVGTHIDQRNNLEIVKKLQRLGRKPITWQQGKRLADKLGAFAYVECSALTGSGVQKVFDEALDAALTPESRRQPSTSFWTEKIPGWSVFQRSKTHSQENRK